MKRVIRENPNASIYSEYIYTHVTNVIRSWNEVLFPALEDHRDEFDLNAICSARNVPNVVLVCCDNCSVYDMLCFDKLVITLKAVTYFEEALK